MKRILSFLNIITIAAMLSGCIISATPKEDPVVLLPGQAQKFTIYVFPNPTKYAWYVEGKLVPGATGNSLTYMLNDMFPSNLSIEARATNLLGTDVYTWNIQYVGRNKPPLAEAGPDQHVGVGITVTLDGSGSTDPDNNIVSYHWEQISGPVVTLSDPHAIKPQFVADVPLGSNLTYQLTVTDAGNLSDSDTCVVTVDSITWNKTFGGSGDDWANSVQQTSDGGYILAGSSLIKTDANGIEQWNKTLSGSASSVQQTSDGGYIMAGSSLIKTDADGIEQWNKTLSDSASSVQQTSDGGYILAGVTGRDARLIKTDTDGIEQWNKTFSGPYSYHTFSVQQTSDGGYILAAWTAGDYRLIKTDADGNEQWSKSLVVTVYPIGSAQQTNEGGYIIVGAIDIFPDHTDGLLIKTDANGDTVWEKTLGGIYWWNAAYSVHQTSDGGYIVAGVKMSYHQGGNDAWLIKTDADGNKLWNKTFGGSGWDGASSVQQTSDGGYIMAASTRSYGAGGYDAWLIKTDANGNAPATPTP